MASRAEPSIVSGRSLRAMDQPVIAIDLKPQLSAEAIHLRLANSSRPDDWSRTLKLSPAATALLECFFPDDLGERGDSLGG